MADEIKCLAKVNKSRANDFVFLQATSPVIDCLQEDILGTVSWSETRLGFMQDTMVLEVLVSWVCMKDSMTFARTGRIEMGRNSSGVLAWTVFGMGMTVAAFDSDGNLVMLSIVCPLTLGTKVPQDMALSSPLVSGQLH